MNSVNKQLLEVMFGTDEALGVMFHTTDGKTAYGLKEYAVMSATGADLPDLVSLLPSGLSAVVCSSYAAHIAQALPGRVELAGFFCTEIPNCGFSKEGLADGHDFAIVDGRYLVDPWPRLVAGGSYQAVFDLDDKADAERAAAFYGARDQWTVNAPDEARPFSTSILGGGHRSISDFDAVEIEEMVVDPMDAADLALQIDYPELPVAAYSVRLHLRSGGVETIQEFRAEGGGEAQLSSLQSAVRLALELGGKIVATDPFLSRSHVLGAGLHRETTVVPDFATSLQIARDHLENGDPELCIEVLDKLKEQGGTVEQMRLISKAREQADTGSPETAATYIGLAL